MECLYGTECTGEQIALSCEPMALTSAKQTLAERRRLQTRDEVAKIAIELFTEVGFDETSMDDVAEHAGVSRRTVYRHFATKADLVFEHPHRWLDHFRSVLGSPGSSTGESASARCERGVREVAEMIVADPEPVLTSFAVRTANPSLGAHHSKSDAVWAELIFVHLLADHGEAAALQCMVCAGALIGATNALFLAWSLSPHDTDLRAMTDLALEQCKGLWP